MAVLVDLPPDLERSLESRARAENVPVERYAAELLSNALAARQDEAVVELNRYLDSMAENAPIELSADECNDAIHEALDAVRPKRAWRR